MQWSNLLKNLCPKCGAELELHTTMTDMMVCKSMACDYKVKPARMQELCMKMQGENLQREAAQGQGWERFGQ